MMRKNSVLEMYQARKQMKLKPNFIQIYKTIFLKHLYCALILYNQLF
jgi:hypothetical protein